MLWISIQFAQYLTYVRNLKFDETPDYKYLINLMDKALISISVEEDGHFDWMDLNGGKGWDAALNKKLIYMVMAIHILLLIIENINNNFSSSSNSSNFKILKINHY